MNKSKEQIIGGIEKNQLENSINEFILKKIQPSVGSLKNINDGVVWLNTLTNMIEIGYATKLGEMALKDLNLKSPSTERFIVKQYEDFFELCKDSKCADVVNGISEYMKRLQNLILKKELSKEPSELNFNELTKNTSN